MMPMLVRASERFLFASRGLLVPFPIGLAIGLAELLLRFGTEVWGLTRIVWSGTDKELLTGLLSLIDFSQLRRRLIATITTIVSVQILKEIESIDDLSDRYLGWLIAMQIAFVVTVLLLSVADRLTAAMENHGREPPPA